jgi:hypothetical protein
MRMVCRLLSVVLLVTAWALPVGADVDATLVYLLPDSQNRYRPVLDDNGSLTVLANTSKQHDPNACSLPSRSHWPPVRPEHRVRIGHAERTWS